jgi:hypothetical protein
MTLRPCVLAVLLLGPAFVLSALRAAEPLSRSFPIDFFRDIPSRNLKGLAARSDGRLVAGPAFTDLTGPAIGDLLWCLEPAAAGKWLVGTGPDGRIVEISVDAGKGSYTMREIADLDEPQVFALKPLSDGSILAGTSPTGALVLVRDGKVTTRVALPVDSIFDVLVLPAPEPAAKPTSQTAAESGLTGTALVATGNPGRIYRVDLKKFAAAGVNAEKLTTAKSLEDKGVTLFTEIQDRNVRRIALLDHQVIAGSSPKGNIYALSEAGGDAVLLQENRDAEVAALLPQSNGDFYAALVFTSTQNESRINRPAPPKPPATETPTESPPPPAPPPAAQAERFGGRSALVYFPKTGFPETVVSRANLAFYTLARRADTVVVGGGEQGDLLGYDVKTRQSLSFPGSASSQLNQMAALPGQADKFLALRNNAPGLALIDFGATSPREAETRRLDLGVSSKLGAFRFNSVRNIDPAQIAIDLRTSWTSDDAEGWRPWQTAALHDDGWLAASAPARYVRVRIKAPASAPGLVLDRASLFFLPQDRRPQLNEFRIVSPNFTLLPAAESNNPGAPTTLGQLITGERERSADDKRKSALLGSGIVPQPGSQIVYWNITDPDGDLLTYSFSIRNYKSDTWLDLAVNVRESFVQFDISHLEDGLYATRLSTTEQAPRTPGDRLTVAFETDDLLIDKTPPVISDAKISREGDTVTVSISGRDELSLLDSAEFTFNNGYHEIVTQPADGIRDSRAETFILRAPLVRTAGATSVEIMLYDDIGNSSARRLELK